MPDGRVGYMLYYAALGVFFFFYISWYIGLLSIEEMYSVVIPGS